MGQILHGSATTTEAVRRAIQHSQESLRTLEQRQRSADKPAMRDEIGVEHRDEIRWCGIGGQHLESVVDISRF